MTDLKPCPFCGKPAHRITPMGFWTKDAGYSPPGVRYVCSSLYTAPLKPCLGSEVFYGDGAEEAAIAAWNTRPAPRVKPLEWVKVDTHVWRAVDPIFGTFYAGDDEMAGVDAHRAARILAALVTE